MHPRCLQCARFQGQDPAKPPPPNDEPVVFFCEAFPVGTSGIPAEILDGDFDHGDIDHEGKAYPGDNGIRFKYAGSLDS